MLKHSKTFHQEHKGYPDHRENALKNTEVYYKPSPAPVLSVVIHPFQTEPHQFCVFFSVCPIISQAKKKNKIHYIWKTLSILQNDTRASKALFYIQVSTPSLQAESSSASEFKECWKFGERRGRVHGNIPGQRWKCAFPVL